MKIIYLHGFASGPTSRKAQFFRQKLAARGIPLHLPDLTAGDFENLTMAGQLKILEDLAAGDPAILIGSSLGGYLAALYASRHPETDRLVLLAPAFDYAHRWESLVGTEALAEWRRTGGLPIYHYGEGRTRTLGLAITQETFEPYPAFPQPTRIYHGRFDTVVPVAYSEQLLARRHPQTAATLKILDTDHGMLTALPEIWADVEPFLFPLP